jgi:hypothetical protein
MNKIKYKYEYDERAISYFFFLKNKNTLRFVAYFNMFS